MARTGRSLSRQSMSQSRMETGNAKHAIHLIDLTADHYFGERQVRPVAGTGIETLDEILEGGLPIGAISELVGPECSRRTSVALSFLARMTQMVKVLPGLMSRTRLIRSLHQPLESILLVCYGYAAARCRERPDKRRITQLSNNGLALSSHDFH